MIDADDHRSSYLEHPFPLLLRRFRPLRLSGTTSIDALSSSLLSTRGTTLASDWEVSCIGLRLRCQARLPEGYRRAVTEARDDLLLRRSPRDAGALVRRSPHGLRLAIPIQLLLFPVAVPLFFEGLDLGGGRMRIPPQRQDGGPY